MIQTAQEMLTALKRNCFRGVILYEGASQIDGAPIVVIANRITTASDNAKTGAMVQTFIIRADIDPMSALKSGDDASVCGNCQHRPANDGSCYVNVGRSVMSTYNAYKRNRYARPGVDYDPAILPDLFAGMIVRLGTYGDPAAAPFQIWRRATLKTIARNGYTHQWRNPAFAAFKTLCMASADSETDFRDAHAMGWRTFRVRAPDAPIFAKLEAACPASHEAGRKASCADCKACGGTSAKARVSMSIIAHGATARRFAAQSPA
jgi:hypothetical protein